MLIWGGFFCSQMLVKWTSGKGKDPTQREWLKQRSRSFPQEVVKQNYL